MADSTGTVEQAPAKQDNATRLFQRSSYTRYLTALTLAALQYSKESGAARQVNSLLHQLGADGRTKIPTSRNVGFGWLTRHDNRLGTLDPAQPGGDPVHRPLGPLGAFVAVEPQAIRSATGGVEQLVVGAVERMFESPRDVPEVGRSAEQVAVRLQHLDGRHGERRSSDDLHALDLGIGRAGQHRLEQLLAMRGRGVVDDQQCLAHVRWDSCIATAFFIVSLARPRSPA